MKFTVPDTNQTTTIKRSYIETQIQKDTVSHRQFSFP